MEDFLEVGIRGGLGLIGENRRTRRKSWAHWEGPVLLPRAAPRGTTCGSGGVGWQVQQSQLALVI